MLYMYVIVYNTSALSPHPTKLKLIGYITRCVTILHLATMSPLRQASYGLGLGDQHPAPR
jgi:hypothetical protein